MNIFTEDNKEYAAFIGHVETIVTEIKDYAKEEDIVGLNKLIVNFKNKTEDFFRENRKLNIGVVGQVKAGKSSFLNTLLFGGKEILPKASTPKTATLTKMEYSEKNIIQIEYYSPNEWDVLEENAAVGLDDEIYTSAREIVGMVKSNGIDPHPYLEKGSDRIEFDSYENLIAGLNDYVGEDGRYTPIVKAVTLYLNKEEFQGLSIVDTPGLNDPIASRTIRTKEFMELCDVVFFLSQSGSFLDKSDWTLLSSQLPQKGVRRLALIASRFDGAVLSPSEICVQADDDPFADDSKPDNIADAYCNVERKFEKRTKQYIDNCIEELKTRNVSEDLINVMKQCEKPLMVSSLAHNMLTKEPNEYTSEERKLFEKIKIYSKDIKSDLELLGNFDEVEQLFHNVASEKEVQVIKEEKALKFIPTATEELKQLLSGYLEKTNKRIHVLESNDREQLLEQKKIIEKQMGSIKSDIAVVFGDLDAKLESEKLIGIRELRDASKDYLNVKERTGSVTRTGSYTSGHLWWKKTEYYSYEEHYSYCIAADAIENLHKYGLDAANQVEEVFCEAIQIKEIKRRLLNVVVNNFDMGSEKYDSSLFKMMVEESVRGIELPIFDIDISDETDNIEGQFNEELTSASQKTALSTALSKAISRIYEELCEKLDDEVKKFKDEMSVVERKFEESLLKNITEEFEKLLSQCDNKEKEIAGYREYAAILEKEISKLS